MEAVWERRQQMIHQPLSNTFFFSPSKSLFFTYPFSFNQHNNNRQIFGLVGGRTRWLKVFNGAKDSFWSKGFISLQSDSWVSSKKQPRSQMLFIQPWIRFRMFWGYEDCCSLLRHRWKIKSDNNEMRLMKDWVTQEDSALVFPLNSIGFFFFNMPSKIVFLFHLYPNLSKKSGAWPTSSITCRTMTVITP